MSLDRCIECNRPVDTDEDLEFFVGDKCICRYCRESMDDFTRESDDRTNDPRHGQAKYINKR